MNIKIYNYLPKESMDIRIEVFVKEQGFIDVPDETDKISAHLVGYMNKTPIATCRIFKKEGTKEYILGRFAVIKEYRGKGIGREILSKAEEYVVSVKGDALFIHSQYHAKGFYEKCGYKAIGELEYEQGEPHVWMGKI